MKKLIALLLFVVCAFQVEAQVRKFYTTDFSYKYYDGYRWSDWSEWDESSMLVVINFNKDLITIYSNEIQEFDIVEHLDSYDDDSGGSNIKFLCVNEEGSRCHIRLRIQSDGGKQLYVDYNDFMYVYNIVAKD